MTRKAIHPFAWLLAAIIAGLSSCESIWNHRQINPYEIVHHTWWNYYRRGRLYLHDGNPVAAKRDFETALGRTSGARYPYARDRWRVRTYGMHMLEGYFPNRELGICLFQLGESEAALQLLETSMQMESSARAKFYINRVREQLAIAAAPPPEITISRFSTATNKRSILLQGSVRGSNQVTRLIIDDESKFIELAESVLRFEREIQLQEGDNTIRMVAEDTFGKQTKTNLTVTADWTPPEIHLQRNGTELLITCRDNIGLQQVRINNHTQSTVGNNYTLTWPLHSAEPIRLQISDLGGNDIDWSLSERDIRHLAETREPAPPRLHLANSGKILTLYNAEYSLDIEAEDDTALRTVELNGTNLLAQTAPLFRTLRRIPLQPGTNHLALAVEDFDGNRTEEQLDVIYRKPEYLDGKYRLATMLPPLEGEIPDARFARRTHLLIGHALTTDPVRFYLLASDDEKTELQNEQILSGSRLADPRALLKKGRKLHSDLLFITRVLRDAPGQTVYTQILDTESGKELFIEDVYIEDPQLLPDQLAGLVMKIEQRFPLIQASIRRQEQRWSIDAGTKNGIQEDMRFLLVHSDGPFEQGRVIMDGNQPAELLVSEVESETARVIMARGRGHVPVRPGNYVYSR